MKSSFLKKNYKKVGALALATALIAGFAVGNGRNLTVSVASADDALKAVTYELADPAKVTMGVDAVNVPSQETIAAAVAGKTVVYTGNNYYMDSAVRSETVVEYEVKILGTGEQQISKKYTPDNGGHEIPVPGYLLSIPASDPAADSYSEGELVTLSGANNQIWPDYTADNLTKRVRVPIHYLNMSVRNKAGIVYYGPEFGADTKQNQWGAELNAELDPTDGFFKVKAFRGVGVGNDKVGITIPTKGFALSAYFEDGKPQPWRAMLTLNVVFSEGDKIEVCGYDYLGLETDVTRYFDYIDPTDTDDPPSAGFPENRGSDRMNIYTKSVDTDGKELNTNSWGFEAAVNAEGVVTALATNVVNIPEGGFVVSGHNTAGDWLKSYVKLGASVTYDVAAKTLRVATTQQSFLTTMQGKLKTYTDGARQRETRLYDLDFAALNKAVAGYKEIVDAATALDAKIVATTDEGQKFLDQVDFKALMNEATAAEKEIIMQLTQCNVIEGRAAWHRPNVLQLEHSLEDLQANLKILSDCGINTIYVEMLWNGYASFKSDFVTYHPDLELFDYGDYPDYFTAFVAEAKKVGIETHAWVENFFVGSTDQVKATDKSHPANYDPLEPLEELDVFEDSIIAKHPDWAQYTRYGKVIQPYEISGPAHFVFIDPARPEVRKFLLDFYEEIYKKFPDVAGLNLDYIRFPTCYGGDDVEEIDSGYTEYAMNAFLEKEGFSVNRGNSVDEFRQNFVAQCAKDEEMASAWHAYRVELITSFVKEVREMTDRVKPDAIISTSTVPDYDDAIETKMQDWRTWVKNGWINLCTPMSYYLSAESVQSNASQMILIIDNISYSYVGLGAYMGFEPVTYVEQIDACKRAGATGYSLFETSSIILNETVQEVLKSTVSSKKSVIPSASAQDVLKASFDDILDKADRIYIPKAAMTQEQKTALSQKFDEILAMPMDRADDLVLLYRELNALNGNVENYFKSASWGVTRVQELLADVMKNVDIKISRAFIAEKQWDPSKDAMRPDRNASWKPTPSGGGGNTTNPNAPSNLGLIIGCSVAAGVVVIAGAVAAVVILRKKKKQ